MTLRIAMNSTALILMGWAFVLTIAPSMPPEYF